jgi:hypothetical protein
MLKDKLIKTIEQDKRFKKEVELQGDVIYSLWTDDFNCFGNTSLSEIIERLNFRVK